MVKRFPLILLLFMTLSQAQDVGTMPKTEPPVFLLKGATVVVGTGQVLSDTSVLVSDGLIQAVGENVPVPDGAWELDVSGMYIYPGLINALSADGFKKAPAPPQNPAAQRGRGRAGQGPVAQSDEGPGYFAHVSAADQLDDDDKKLSGWREAGVLTLNVAPDQGIFRGTTAVVNLNGEEGDRMIVRQDVMMPMSFRGLGFRTYPGSLMGVIAHIRQTLQDAGHYKEAWDIYQATDRGLKRPETDRTLKALQPVIDGSVPLVFPAQEDREIRRALALCAESKTRCVIAGGFDVAAVADELKEMGVPVLVSLNYPQKSKDGHPEADESLETLRRRTDAPKASGRLEKAGVKFAFYSDGVSASDFLKNIRKAVENGLSEEEAVRSATLSAAEILGVDSSLGTVEVGKIANLVVADKQILADDAKIKHVFVDGYHFEVPVKKTAKKEDSAGLSQVGGTWDVTVTTPDQDRSLTFEIAQDGSSLSGTVTTEMGSLDVYEGTVSGDGFSFKIEITMGMGPMEITFSGTVSGDTMTGTASVAEMGDAPMEGKRVP